ncbi:unnamed protein product [Adineta steineri]|uniref:U-box domain-containing protein n=2 Tax=Adineta steineri TaxID=433720 RepID=A0A813MR49_9BILA|nr:unnamed protein product [Adineta steineri]CAF3595180.1 unnamed protein product [Adineta steineri]
MENTSDTTVQSNHDLICPITLEIYRDPVLAEDGHIYERTAISQWIKQQGTSPLTREPLDINNLRSDENIKQLCQSYRSDSITYKGQMNLVSITTNQLDAHAERQIPCKQKSNTKRTLLIIIIIISIISSLIIATFVILFHIRSNSVSETSTINKNPLTIYKLPNNCTLSTIVPLFSWNNMKQFNYTYYSKLYKATSTQTILTFAFRNDPSYWCLDNVSVMDISLQTELIINGGFENNPSDGFFRCNSYGNSSLNLFLASPYPYKGKRSFCDGSVGLPDYLNQRLHTKIGHVYHISFWLQNMGDVLNSAQVVMSH